MTTCENQYFQRTMTAGVVIRAAMVPTIFRHSLRMSNEARQEKSIGNIVNLMTTDVEKIVMSGNQIHNMWSCPMRLILGLYLLISNLGVAGVFGFISVIILIPLQSYIMKKVGEMTRIVMKSSDTRIKLINEVFSGMRVIKYVSFSLLLSPSLSFSLSLSVCSCPVSPAIIMLWGGFTNTALLCTLSLASDL